MQGQGRRKLILDEVPRERRAFGNEGRRYEIGEVNPPGKYVPIEK